MTESSLLAIDAGTGSCRAALFAESGRQLALAQREYSHASVPQIPGSQVFDTAGNWKLICDCVREALAQAGLSASAVRAVSATSMREGMVLYDAGGREIWACPNVDARSAVEATELVRSGEATEIYERAGDWVAITAPARFRWLAAHEPEIFAAIAHVGMLGDWILYRLCGRFATDPSLGSSSGMFDVAERHWSPRIVELCGLDIEVFPPVVEPGTIIGAVTSTASAETGLAEGTPVVVAGADTQLGLVGIGASTPGSFAIVGGSFWQHAVIVDGARIDSQVRLRTLCHTVPDRWMLEGIGFYSGLTMRWFRDAFCSAESAEAERNGRDVYTDLEGLAADVPPGANGIFGIFSNLMDAKRWVHASPALVGFDITQPQTSGKKECIRAIEESAAYVALGHLKIVEEIIASRIERAVFTGGAAHGRLWAQILADVLGVPVDVPVVKESSALGAALYAGAGIGVFDDVGDVGAHLVTVERTYEPAPETHAVYAELYERWRQLYERSLEISELGIVRPLWRAAGA